MWMLSKVKNHRINKNTHYNQQRMNTYIQVSGIKQDHKKKKKKNNPRYIGQDMRNTLRRKQNPYIFLKIGEEKERISRVCV